MTQCQIVLEVTVADCSTQLVQRRETLVVRTIVMYVVACSGDCCRTAGCLCDNISKIRWCLWRVN